MPAQYCAARLDSGIEVERARQKIADRAGVPYRVEAPLTGALHGCIDMIYPGRIGGWAQNVEHPAAPVCLDILAGGELIGRVVANRYRADLERAGIGTGEHGFEFVLPAGVVAAAGALQVRRALDGAALELSSLLKQKLGGAGDRPRASISPPLASAAARISRAS
jgi:hypothetical protein